MANFNKVIIAGYITRKPEMRYTPKGTAICQFGVATNHTWKSEAGEQKQEAMFIEVSAWGKTGEAIAKYMDKGRPILIEGRLKLDQWDDKETGAKRSKHTVVCESFQFMDKKQDGEAPSDDGDRFKRAVKSPEQSAPADDDVPF